MAEEENEKKEEILKIYKIFKTITKMMEDRGFEVSDKDKTITAEEWCKENTNPDLFVKTYEKIDQNTGEKIKLFCQYSKEAKYNISHCNNFIKNLNEIKAVCGIIIIPGVFTHLALEKIKDLNQQLNIEYFTASELMVNITEHELVPKHILLDETQKEALLKRYRIKESQLPKILITDPVAKYLGLKRGNVVKIVRASETAGSYVTYRIAY